MVEDKVKLFAEDANGNKVLLREVSASELLQLFPKANGEIVVPNFRVGSRLSLDESDVVPNFFNGKKVNPVAVFTGKGIRKHQHLFGKGKMRDTLVEALSKHGALTTAQATEVVSKMTGYPYKALYGRVSGGLCSDYGKRLFDCEQNENGFSVWSLKPHVAQGLVPMLKTSGSPFTSGKRTVGNIARVKQKRLFANSHNLTALIKGVLSKERGSPEEITSAIAAVTNLPVSTLLRRKVANGLHNGYNRKVLLRELDGVMGEWLYSLNPNAPPSPQAGVKQKRLFGRGQLTALVKNVLEQRGSVPLESVAAEVAFLTKKPAPLVYKSVANTLSDGVRRKIFDRVMPTNGKYGVYSIKKEAGTQ